MNINEMFQMRTFLHSYKNRLNLNPHVVPTHKFLKIPRKYQLQVPKTELFLLVIGTSLISIPVILIFF